MQTWLLLAGVSFVSALGVAIPQCWVLAPAGLAGFFYILWHRIKSVQHAALYGLIFGAITGGAGTIWLWEILPLDWLPGPSPVTGPLAVGFTWLYSLFALGLGVALLSPLFWAIRNHPAGPLVAGLVWGIAEEARMWIFSFATWAPQSLLGPHFSIASLGYALAENSYALQIAYPFGIFALNAAAGLIAAAIAAGYAARQEKPWRLRAGIALAGVVAIFLIPALLQRTPEPSSANLRVALIGTDISARERDFTSARPLLEQAANVYDIDLIVLPEGVGLQRIFTSDFEKRLALANAFGETDTLILHSTHVLETSYEHKTLGKEKLFFESTVRGVLATQDKLFLMPMGEYAPSVPFLFYSLLPNHGFRGFLNYVERANARGEELIAFPYRGATIGALLCSELLSASLYRDMVQKKGATLLVNMGNDSWFHDSHALFSKTLQMAKVRAVENRTPLVSARNEAPSFALNGYGQVIAMTDWGGSHILVVEIP